MHLLTVRFGWNIKDFFEEASKMVPLQKNLQLHDQYASPETWAKAREILASCPTQRDLSTAWLDHWEGCSEHQQARQSWFIFFSQLAKMG